MRRLIVGGLAATLAALGMVVGLGTLSPAFACERVGPGGICLDDVAPGDGGGGGGGGDHPGGGPDTGPVGCPSAPGGQCTDAAGNYWNAEHRCYAAVMDPQPGPDDPVWDANGIEPGAGQFYWCVSGGGAVWFTENGEAPVVDAAAIARQLVLRAPFEVADVHTAPDSQYYTLIRLENWLWIPEAQWHDVSLTENVGPASVTLTATPTRVEWVMGDGQTMNCYDAGREWRTGMGDAARSSCSYAYDELSPKGAGYTISGRLHYEVSWTCTGQCSAPAGDLGEYPAPATTSCLEVRERQSVNTTPGGAAGGGSNTNLSTACP